MDFPVFLISYCRKPQSVTLFPTFHINFQFTGFLSRQTLCQLFFSFFLLFLCNLQHFQRLYLRNFCRQFFKLLNICFGHFCRCKRKIIRIIRCWSRQIYKLHPREFLCCLYKIDLQSCLINCTSSKCHIKVVLFQGTQHI